MCDAGAAFILERARQGRFVTYGGLWSQVELLLGRSLGNRWRQQRSLLRDISDRTFEQTGALISALVVEDGASEEPQRGFFRLAADRGMLAEDDAPEEGEPWTGMTPRQREFWQSQLRKLGFPDVDG
jgi:hypothetical protein